MIQSARKNLNLVNNTLKKLILTIVANILLDEGQAKEALKLLDFSNIHSDSNIKYLLLKAVIILKNYTQIFFLVRNLMKCGSINMN
ncbi:MAG: hypothetical protein IR526_02440 [Bordetella sp.]|nr:MAG: hypothetical protein IR526_02440 [Bordetella sp.]